MSYLRNVSGTNVQRLLEIAKSTVFDAVGSDILFRLQNVSSLCGIKSKRTLSPWLGSLCGPSVRAMFGFTDVRYKERFHNRIRALVSLGLNGCELGTLSDVGPIGIVEGQREVTCRRRFPSEWSVVL